MLVKKLVKKRLQLTCLRVTKLIINEQVLVVRKSKRLEYTPSKLYENKRRVWKSHQRHHHKVQEDYF